METRVQQGLFNPFYMMADSGARGSAAQIRQLAGMRGLMARPDGSIIETPITANFREGLTYCSMLHLDAWCPQRPGRYCAQNGQPDTRPAGWWMGCQDMVVLGNGLCTDDGLIMAPIIEGGDVVEPLHERILGRTATDLYRPGTNEIVIPAGTLLGEGLMQALEELGIDQVKVDPPSAVSHLLVCSKMLWEGSRKGHQVNLGESVGVIAAQSIGEPGTQPTMRTFHIGGAAS